MVKRTMMHRENAPGPRVVDPREGPDSVTDPRRFRAAPAGSGSGSVRRRGCQLTAFELPSPFIILRIRVCGNVGIARRSIVPGAPSLFFINRIRACGNVGIVRRFPRAVGRVGNPVSGFPRFPPTVISIGSAAAPGLEALLPRVQQLAPHPQPARRRGHRLAPAPPPPPETPG
jgi:hypothetical protein